MFLNKFYIAISIVALLFVSNAGAAFEETSYQETWHGNCLWIKSQENVVGPGWIDPAKWIAKFPGAWGKPMASFSISTPANAGMKDIYWDVYNSNAMILYPSELFKDKVYRNKNAGYDFFSTDMPLIAGRLASLDEQYLRYVIWWNEGNVEADITAEVLDRYPLNKIAIVCDEQENDAVKVKLGEKIDDIDYDRIEFLSNKDISEMTDLTMCNEDPLKSHDFHKEMIHKYLYFGKAVFKRKIVIYDEGQRCSLAVSGRNKWHVFVNGKYIASGNWKNGTWQDMAFLSGTYDVSELMHPGKNEIMVCVESGYNERAFMANIKVGDMVYRSDDNWKALPVKEVPTEETLNEMCGAEKDWHTPVILSRANVWPNTMGKVYWHRLYPWQKEVKD
ncbi:MAG: hypothetical protein ACIAQZ_15625 [Sedimentisphaeraceae bacterium JB056]